MYTTPTLTLVRPHTPTLADEMDEARKADLSRLNAALARDLGDYASAISAGLADNIHFTHGHKCPIRDARYCSGVDGPEACIAKWERLATLYDTHNDLNAADYARCMIIRLTLWSTWDMGDIGEPLHVEEGEEEDEPLYVPDVVPARPEPVPA